MADTNFPSKFYFELRYNGNPGVLFSDGLSFVDKDFNEMRFGKYKVNGTVVVWEINLGTYNIDSEYIRVDGIKGCTVTSGQFTPGSNYDYSYSDTIPTYYLNVTPAASYTCHVYSGSTTANSIASATVAILYDGNGKTYAGLGQNDYRISATTNSSGNATLRWFSGSPIVRAWKGTIYSSGSSQVSSTATTNIRISRDTVVPIDTYAYTGYLKDAINGTAIANATVSTIDGSGIVGTSDSLGYFSFRGGSLTEDPGNKWGDITGADGYVPFHGIISSTCSSDISIPVYYLYPDDSLPPYDIDFDKILTIYDIARLMYDQWNDVSKEIVCRTLNVEDVETALRSLVNKYCIKDSNGTLVDFSGKPSGYCPTAFVWDADLSEWGIMPGLSNDVSREVIGYGWADPDALAGCSEYPFELYCAYGRCNAYANSDFYKMYTISLSSTTASLNFIDYDDGTVFDNAVSLVAWNAHSGSFTFAYGDESTTGISYTVSLPSTCRILSNRLDIPLTWRLVIDEGTSLGKGVYPRVLDAKDALEVGNDKFTVQTYTTSRRGNKVTVQISGYFNMIDFQNDFKFKIPVDTKTKTWNFILPDVGGYGDGIVDTGDSGIIQLVSSTGTSFTLYATSAAEVSSSGVFPSRTLTTTGYRPTFANGLYLKFIGTKSSFSTYKYLKATIGSQELWFDVTFATSGYNVYVDITSILDTDDYITYDITEGTATVSFGHYIMSWHITKS